MKKIYSLLFIALTSASFGQVFTAPAYDFASVTTSSGATDPTPVPGVPGVSFGSFTAFNGVTAPTNSNAGSRFSFTNQPLGATNGVNTYATMTGALDPTIYFEVAVGPFPGGTIDLTGITFTSQRSGTGIRAYAVRSSVDGFAANLPASINPANAELSIESPNVFFRVNDATTTAQNGSTVTLGAGFAGLTAPVTFRFYAWDAEALGGTFSIDNVVFSGNVVVLGSSSFSQIDGLKMYPNPTKSNLFIETALKGDANVSIVNMLGKEVVNTKVVNNTVNVSNLTSGIYIVKITEEGKTSTKKLIIE